MSRSFASASTIRIGAAALACTLVIPLVTHPVLAHPGHYFTPTPEPGLVPGIATSELIAAGVVLVSLPLVGTYWYVKHRHMTDDEIEQD